MGIEFLNEGFPEIIGSLSCAKNCSEPPNSRANIPVETKDKQVLTHNSSWLFRRNPFDFSALVRHSKDCRGEFFGANLETSECSLIALSFPLTENYGSCLGATVIPSCSLESDEPDAHLPLFWNRETNSLAHRPTDGLLAFRTDIEW